MKKLSYIFLGTILCSILLFSGLPPAISRASDIPSLAKTLAQPSHYIFLRHTLAPGTGDPDDFDLDDCTTQRNLNDTGRSQARALGAALKQHGITIDRIYTSQWCRCRDTATLLDLGDVTPLPALNSVWLRPQSYAQSQNEKLTNFIQTLPPEETVLFVTHYANIKALMNVPVSSGEAVVARWDGQRLIVVDQF